MRLRAIRLGVLAAVSGLVLACGGDDGGDKPAGGAGTNGSDECPAFKSCGGDPAGEWTVDNLCVTEPQGLFAATVSQAACSSALKGVKDVDGSGTYKLGADKNAVSGIIVSGTASFSFSDACAKALGVAQSAASECPKIEAEFKKESAVKSAVCTPGGSNCDCEITSDLSLAGNGSYTVSNNEIMVSGLTQPFCVEGDTLTIQTTRSGSTLTFTLKK
jgi:hypothetical protein